jgi:hypothetical protein
MTVQWYNCEDVLVPELGYISFISASSFATSVSVWMSYQTNQDLLYEFLWNFILGNFLFKICLHIRVSVEIRIQ